MRFMPILCGLMVVSLASAANARVWTDAGGTTQIDAEFVRYQEDRGVVTLRLADGKFAEVALSKLSPTDRQFVTSGAAATARDQADEAPEPAAPEVVEEEPSSSAERFDRAVENNPDDPDAYYNRGIALASRGLYKQALEDFNKAIELNPEFAEAYDGRGVAYAKLKDPVRAHEDFNEAIELNPELASAYKHRGDNLPAYAKTPQGKVNLEDRIEQFRRKYNAVARNNRRNTPWQPLNNTTGNVSRPQAVMALVKQDRERYRELDRGGYGRGGESYGGVHYGGVGYGGGPGKGPGPGPGPGYKPLVTDPALQVMPGEVKQGETITLVANPAELVKGLAQELAAAAPFPEQFPNVYAPNARVPRNFDKKAKDIEAVDFYMDVDKDNLLNGEMDKYLGTDTDGSDGFTKEVPTAMIPPGTTTFFAVPRGGECPSCEEEGEKPQSQLAQDLKDYAQMLERASQEEALLAQAAREAAEAAGLEPAASDAMAFEHDTVSGVAEEVRQAVKDSHPTVANMLRTASTPLKDVASKIEAARQNPGEPSKTPAEQAAGRADHAAEQLAKAADALKEAAEQAAQEASEAAEAAAQGEGDQSDPQAALANVAKGLPAGAQGRVLPKEGAPAPGSGEGSGGGPGSGGDGDGHYAGDDDADIHNHYGDDIHVDERRDEAIERALGYVDDDDYDRAVVEYDRLVEDYPDDLALVRRRGDVLLEGGRYTHAVRDYDRLLDVRQPSADLYYNRGCAYLAAGELESALADFTKSIELNETWNLAYNNRGTTYAKMGDYEKAIADFEKAIDLKPNDALAYRNRALALKKLGRTEKAKADLETYERLSEPDGADQ